MSAENRVRRALLSVSDKTDLLIIARALHREGFELLSTSGTAKALREGGLPVTDISEYTGQEEAFDGRLKTIHPRIAGGLLYIRENAKHEADAKKYNIPPIDVVVVNLYPFEKTVAKPETTFNEAVEQIDIGGPNMLRAGAKNHESVTVVVDPADYASVAAEFATYTVTSPKTRRRLAKKVFGHTGAYDKAIEAYFEKMEAAEIAA